MNIPEKAVIQPKMVSVADEDIAALTKVTEVNRDLLAFWKDHGAGTFNRDRNGNRVDDMINNRLLDPEEVLELLEGATSDIAALVAVGTPFFNK
ncbi:hypothetical protein Q5692_40290, partial [Microcoleus sp. C2C3]|uniref:hypothetical protein n=1 Tax=Microcoleus sp. C2C3 TaxID=3055324 RepID=UPI002FD45910